MEDSKRSTSPEQQVRLMMWTIPRTTATCLVKCLSFVEDSLIFYEVFSTARWLRADEPPNAFTSIVPEIAAAVPQVTDGYDMQEYSSKGVKERLEEAHPGKKFIVCKDLVTCAVGKREFLPKGYRQLFLIRHPLKVFPSWKKLFQFAMKAPLDEFRLYDMPPEMLPSDYGFKELSELLDHVKEVYDEEVIIIDSDDLLEDPKGILSALFETIGLPFDERILQWDASDAITKDWVHARILRQSNHISHFYKRAFASSCFTKPSDLPDRSSLSPDILHCVDASMPYYEKMYAQRLMPK